MDDPLIARLAAAADRIERATERQRDDAGAMSRRHAALRTRMAEAVKALDEVIARGEG